jgi:hypothetical protein
MSSIGNLAKTESAADVWRARWRIHRWPLGKAPGSGAATQLFNSAGGIGEHANIDAMLCPSR